MDLEGGDDLRRKLEPVTLLGGPLYDFHDRSTRFLQGEIRVRMMTSWHDRGQAAQDVTTRIESASLPLWSMVGGNDPKLRWGEYGTGLLSEDPKSNKKRHFPPPGALQMWARRHGFKDDPPPKSGRPLNIWRTAGGKVAKAIGKRGGIEPRRFMRETFAEAPTHVRKFLQILAQDIEALWAR
jgi:hypothetical protein